MLDTNILKCFYEKNILVTGGTGLIGRQIVDILVETGAHVTVASLDDVDTHPKAKKIHADLCDFSTCKRITYEIEYVFHLAGIKASPKITLERPATFFVPLLMMNTNILEASRLNGIGQLVYTSSIGAYGVSEIFRESENSDAPPMDTFPGWAKRMAEKQIEAYRIENGIGYSIVRLANVFGPGDNFDPENAMVISSLMAKIRRGDNPVVVWGDGSPVRDFLYSKDAAEGIIQALYCGTQTYSLTQNDPQNEFINLGSGVGYSIRELVETLHSFIDFNYEFNMEGASFSKRIMDISLARKHLHFEPQVSLKEGLMKTWKWYNDNYNEHLKKKNYFKPEEGS